MIPPSSPAPAPVSLPRILLVEGITPMHFFEALLRQLSLEKEIEVRNFGGIKDLKTYLKILVATAEFQDRVKSVGIIRDAETDAIAARQSVDGALRAAQLIPDRTAIKTAIFILPDNAGPGMIETLCMRAVDNEPNLSAPSRCTKEFITCLEKNGVELPDEPKLAKNRAQAFLATQMDVQMYPGQAAYRGLWPFANGAFDAIKVFLQSM